MNFINQIINCKNDEEVDIIVEKRINELNDNSDKIEQLGFINPFKGDKAHKGFIPLKTKIKYAKFNIETYGMETTDFFYEFSHAVRKYNMNTKNSIIQNIEWFLNIYFGYTKDTKYREQIFYHGEFETDEDFFNAIDNNKIGDLKGKNAALCSEKSAIAEQLLSLFDFETYYCYGCVKRENEEGHCFNVVRAKNGYALVDYSIPVSSYDKNGNFKGYLPFVDFMSDEDFKLFINGEEIKEFPEYTYVDGKKIIDNNQSRLYVSGRYEISDSKNK